MLNINIDGIDIQVEENTTVLEAAHKVGIDIPTLCHDKYLSEFVGCRMFLVEIE